MKRLLLSLVAVLSLAGVAAADTVNFGSDTTWGTTNSSNVNIGSAQQVCLNASSPSPCPSGALQYGYGGSGWGVNLSSIPGASWIWAPGVTGSTPTGVEFAAYTFSNSFFLNGTPTSGSISISADDFAQVIVNGTLVGTIGSLTNASLAGAAASGLTTFDILPFLVSGNNTIQIFAQNGQGAFAGCTNCTYSQHPAGVVFGGVLTSTGATPVPEPATGMLLAIGLAGVASLRRRIGFTGAGK